MTILPRSPGLHWSTRPPRRQGRRRASTLVALLGLFAVLLIAACSGSAGSSGVATLVDPSASPDPSPSASLDPEDAMQAFAACMREHGVDIQVSTGKFGPGDGGPVTNSSSPDPATKGGGGIDKDKLNAADKACKSLLPAGGVNGPGGEIDPEFQDKMLAFAKCMREHGIDMPDPQFGSGGNTVTIGGPDDGSDSGPRFDPESQDFQDAQAACGDLLPGKLGSGPVAGDGGAGKVEVVAP